MVQLTMPCCHVRWWWGQVLKERPPQPSNFCLKLRKHVRTRRLEDVRQLGEILLL